MVLECQEPHLGQADLNHSIVLHLRTDINVLDVVSVSHLEGWHTRGVLHIHINLQWQH